MYLRSVFLTPSSLASRGFPVLSYFWISLDVLLKLPIFTFQNVQVRLVGAFTVCVEPVRVLSRWFSAPPELHVLDHIFFLSYVLFSHAHTYLRGPPLTIVWSSQAGKWWIFLIHTVICISWPIYFSAWFHKYHWCLFPWVFISLFSSCQHIFL